jgi:hypothetical protein
MSKLFKVIASRAGQIVIDDRLEAKTPREARVLMRNRLGLSSLTGLVYAITEIPVDLIREVVNARMAEVMSSAPDQPPIDLSRVIAATVDDVVTTRLRALEERVKQLETERESGSRRRFDAFIRSAPPTPEPLPSPTPEPAGPDWTAIRAFYAETGSPKQTAARFNLPINTVKARVTRERWPSPRRRQTGRMVAQ